MAILTTKACFRGCYLNIQYGMKIANEYRYSAGCFKKFSTATHLRIRMTHGLGQGERFVQMKSLLFFEILYEKINRLNKIHQYLYNENNKSI